MKKYVSIIIIILACISIFNIIAPLTVSYAQDFDVDGGGAGKDAYGTAGPFQTEISNLLIQVGDYFNRLLTALVRQEVTIDGLIFNKIDAVNANFFEKSTFASRNPLTDVMRDSINSWYKVFKELAILVYFISLVAIGTKVLLDGTAFSKAKWQDVIIKWTTGIMILFLFPYVMRYAFDINEAMLVYISNGLGGTGNKMEISIGRRRRL